MEDLLLGVDVQVITRTLTVDELPERQKFRLNLILDLSNQGLSNKQISNHLNGRGIRTPRDKIYSQKLVWATLKKARLREERINDTTIVFGTPCFYEKQSVRR